MGNANELKQRETVLTKIIVGGNLNRKDAALVYNNRGHTKYLLVNFDGAIDDYTAAIKIDPGLAVAYYNRGTIYYRLGMLELAKDDMEQAVRLDPKNEEFNKGLVACSTRKTVIE